MSANYLLEEPAEEPNVVSKARQGMRMRQTSGGVMCAGTWTRLRVSCDYIGSRLLEDNMYRRTELVNLDRF